MNKPSESPTAANDKTMPKCLYRPDDGEKFLLGKDHTYYMERSYMKPPYRYSYEKLMECGFLTQEEFVAASSRRNSFAAESEVARNSATTENPQNLEFEKGKLVASIAAQMACASMIGSPNARIRIEDAVNAAKSIVEQSFTKDSKADENPS